MRLTLIDWSIIAFFFFTTLFIGGWAARKAGKSSEEFFLSGRNMPWWLLGISMVATTFSTDTPNLVTDIVRQNGVMGNWVWWAFLLTGMLTVFIYAKLWRKTGINTDMEFYEFRYSGKPARFLRGFRALYLGIAFNVLSMAAVTLAAIKIGEVLLGLSPWATVGIASVVTVIFSALGGFRGVILTDFILFFTAMVGAIGAAWYAVQHPEVGGLSALLSHENVQDKLEIFPAATDTSQLISLLIIPLAVQWWSSWYPGSEPGGGGYIAQRMLAAKNERHAIGATLFFNIAHYALRPWPWILVALASLVLFPDLASLQAAFPNISADKLGHDLAYPAMLTFLPAGFLGVVMASLIAAYMSTISTHLNWGASYLVFDFYKRFVSPNASQATLVMAGRIITVVLMVLAALVALSIRNAKQIFDFVLLFGAGTGLIFILRWFWWRINAWSEIAAMFASGVVALLLEQLAVSWASSTKLLVGVATTTAIWVVVTYLTPPEPETTFQVFYRKTGIALGGSKFVQQKSWVVQRIRIKWGILAMVNGCLLVYSFLFMVGYLLYGEYLWGALLGLQVCLSSYLLVRWWRMVA